MEDGIAKKMSKKELDAYVAKKVKEAVDDGYSPEPNAIDVLRDDGISRGLSGKKLENFIKDELDNNHLHFLRPQTRVVRIMCRMCCLSVTSLVKVELHSSQRVTKVLLIDTLQCDLQDNCSSVHLFVF